MVAGNSPRGRGAGMVVGSAPVSQRRHSWSMQGLQRISPGSRSPRSPSDCGGLPPPSPRTAQHGFHMQQQQQQQQMESASGGGSISRTASTPPKYPSSLSTTRVSRTGSGQVLGHTVKPPPSRTASGMEQTNRLRTQIPLKATATIHLITMIREIKGI